jgi:hypothetical protein
MLQPFLEMLEKQTVSGSGGTPAGGPQQSAGLPRWCAGRPRWGRGGTRGARAGTWRQRRGEVEEDDVGFVVVGLDELLFGLLVGYSWLRKKSSGRYIEFSLNNAPPPPPTVLALLGRPVGLYRVKAHSWPN